MNKPQSAARAQKLRNQINEYRYRYHVLDDPAISDEVYDSLTKELKTIEGEYPELITADSPTQRVGGQALDAFRKVTHSSRMISLNDVFSREDVEAWIERMNKLLPGREEKGLGGRCNRGFSISERRLNISRKHVLRTRPSPAPPRV